MENKHWYKHPGILKSWLAEQLYGSRNKTNTSKVSRKIKDGSWNDLEREALHVIRREFIKNIRDGK